MFIKISCKFMVLFLVTVFFISGFSFKQYSLNLKSYDQAAYRELCGLIEDDVKPVEANIYVFENIREFCGRTGAPYWIKGFTNNNGIYVQSPSLLGVSYSKTVLHELLHWTIRRNLTLPEWYEEGLVCIITGETEGVESVPVMKNPEQFDTGEAQNDWQLLSYELGCVEKVKRIIEEVKH